MTEIKLQVMAAHRLALSSPAGNAVGPLKGSFLLAVFSVEMETSRQQTQRLVTTETTQMVTDALLHARSNLDGNVLELLRVFSLLATSSVGTTSKRPLTQKSVMTEIRRMEMAATPLATKRQAGNAQVPKEIPLLASLCAEME